MTNTVINAVLFQLGWFACVTAGASSWHVLGSLVVLAICAYHLMRAAAPGRELKLFAICAVVGVLWDGTLVTIGVLSFDHGNFHTSMAPHWMIALWLLFATTLNVSMNWLKRRWVIAALLGGLGGPLAYYGGQKLQAVTIHPSVIGLTVMSLGWAILIPLMCYLSERFNGFAESPRLELSR